MFFFFKQKTAYEMRISDWSSDVCSSDLHWGVGQEGKDNGVLLIVAPEEREVRIEVGYGLEGTLTDAVSSQIIRNEILPRFRRGDMAGGIVAGRSGERRVGKEWVRQCGSRWSPSH